MKQIVATLTDDQIHHLEELARQMSLTVEELVVQSIAAYLERVQAALVFDPVGVGMWKDRPEMEDPVQWVSKLREQEWRA